MSSKSSHLLTWLHLSAVVWSFTPVSPPRSTPCHFPCSYAHDHYLDLLLFRPILVVDDLSHFSRLLCGLGDGDTLGFQGSDVLLSGGGPYIAHICLPEINGFKLWVLLLVGDDSFDHLVTQSIS